MYANIIVTEHTGFPERQKGAYVPCPPSVEGDLKLVILDGEEIRCVPSVNVFTPEGLRYAEEWAAKTHKSIYDIRVPNALQPS